MTAATAQRRRKVAPAAPTAIIPVGPPMQRINAFFSQQGWQPLAFQREVWQAYSEGDSGLLYVPTGSGKTYAAFFGPLSQLLADPPDPKTDGLRIIYITPLRALSRDVEKAISKPCVDLGLNLRIETRTGDTKASQRLRQKKLLPHILITTPESFALLLSYPEARAHFAGLKSIIIDEWHELAGAKRGILLELGLARVRALAPGVQTWALSATLANPAWAAEVAVGTGESARVIKAAINRPVNLRSLLPDAVDAFPWAGHLGLAMRDKLVADLNINQSTLIFTNTRYQAEKWYQEILTARPEWAGLMAMHHGSLDIKTRDFVETSIKSGAMRLVVCTSSLDLGVDFPQVERVYQIGSPKGIARIVQRAGRASHRAGEPCAITCVPTHALELIEFAATRQAILGGEVEARPSLQKPYDVLAQHLVSCAAGDGFIPAELFVEVQKAHSYQHLTWQEFNWVLELVAHGGANLHAYSDYHKIAQDEAGVYRITSPRLSHIHRMNIGTINSDAQLQVKFLRGKALGFIEEGFVSRLKRGDRFVFAGRTLELFRIEDDVALVKLSAKKSTAITKWPGSRLPISESLSEAIREVLAASEHEQHQLPELAAIATILQNQARLSAVPEAHQLLIETCKTREGYHLFLYPFEGRLVHEGLAPLLAYRFAQWQKASFALTVNDYGLELVCKEPFPYAVALAQQPFTTENLAEDILASLNVSNMAKRQFRDIARICGLVNQNYPGRRHLARQLQASASLIFDVFKRYEPENLLLKQSEREALDQFFEQSRLQRTLQRLQTAQWLIRPVAHPTPFGFPLLTERVASHLSNESIAERVAKLIHQWSAPT
ncbi:MAG TPA: ligase-associated DNA damage response DEXH box helicase [Cellvibrionaceae bacterium]